LESGHLEKDQDDQELDLEGKSVFLLITIERFKIVIKKK